MTFSTLPSVFQFFLFKRNVADFAAFIESVGAKNGRLCKQYLRCVFWTPSFLGFVSDVFGPHLVRLARSMTSPTQCVQAMKQALEKGDRLLPGYICMIFERENIKKIVGSSKEKLAEFLQESFLCELARAPQRCLVCQFYDSYDQTVAKELEELLRNEIAVCLAARLLGGESEECVEKDCSVYVFNELDAALIKKEANSPAAKLRTFVVDYTKQNKQERMFTTITGERLRSKNSLLAQGIRQLLKTAPVLPDSLEHLGYQTEQDWCASCVIEEWLVNHADAENIVHQTILFRKIQDDLDHLSSEEWKTVFAELCPEMTTSVKPEKRKIARQIAMIDSLSNVARIRAQNVLFFRFLRVWHQLEQPKLVWGTCRDYACQAPQRPLSVQCETWSNSFKSFWLRTKGPALSACWAQVHLHYAFSVTKFDFYTYCILHPELQSYDRIVAGQLSSINAHEIVNKTELQESRDKLLKFMHHVIRDAELRREACDVFNENCDPLTKADRLSEFLTNRLQGIAASIWDGGEITGEIRTAITELFFAYGWQPTRLASVFWFISECKRIFSQSNSASGYSASNSPRSLDEVHTRLLTIARQRQFDCYLPTWEKE